MSKYIALQSVGRFKSGDEVTGQKPHRIEFLLAEGAIKEVKEQAKAEPKESKTTKTNSKK